MDDKTLIRTALECQQLARALGDRQNSESTLAPKMATRLVNCLLNAGNTLEQLIRERAATPAPAPETPTEVT